MSGESDFERAHRFTRLEHEAQERQRHEDDAVRRAGLRVLPRHNPTLTDVDVQSEVLKLLMIAAGWNEPSKPLDPIVKFLTEFKQRVAKESVQEFLGRITEWEKSGNQIVLHIHEDVWMEWKSRGFPIPEI